MIQNNSHLNNLPRYLHPHQVLLIDGIRISASIVNLKSITLHQQLRAISFEAEHPPSHIVFEAAWSIIDNTHRFLKFAKLFEDQTGWRTHNRLLSIGQKIKMLRDTIQHIDERVEQVLVEKESVLFGQIGWIARMNPNDTHGYIYSMTCGHYPYPNQNFEVINPVGMNVARTVDKVCLTAVGRFERNQYESVTIEIAQIAMALTLSVADLEGYLQSKISEHSATETLDRDIILKARFSDLTATSCTVSEQVEFLRWKPSTE